MSELIFDGHDFSTLFEYGDPEIQILNAKPDVREISGRHGEALVGLTYGAASVAFTVAAIGAAAARRAAFSTLGQWLMVDDEKGRPLYLPDTPDRYYLAVPEGSLDLQRGMGSETAKVTFKLVDPIAYGATQTATLPSGSSVSITVGGTAPTHLDATASAAVRNSTAQVWGMRVDGADYVHVPTGSDSSRRVVLSSKDRSCKVAGATKLPTLDSDWLVLEPGTHTVLMDYGTGAATLSWVERWY